jgi:hypothetical protein
MRLIRAFVLALVGWATAAQPGVAQIGPAGPSIPANIRMATSALAAGDLKIVDDYVRHWIEQLTNGETEQISRARDQLIAPIDSGGSPIFLNAYSSAASRRLTPVVATDDPAVGLNAMIVASRLMDVGVIEVIRAGLANQRNVPVRYWAAKSVELLPSNLARRDPNLRLTPTEQRTLLDALVKTADAETSEYVMRQLLPSLVSLKIPEANPALIKVLDTRVASHAKDPNGSVGPEVEALRRMFSVVVTETIEARNRNQPINVALLTQIARVSFLYLDLSTTSLRKGVTGQAAVDHRAMVGIADSFLRFSVEQVKPESRAQLPGKPEQFDPNWGALAAEIAKWPVILTGAPFNFDAKALNVQG